jgi:hypothetical protein
MCSLCHALNFWVWFHILKIVLIAAHALGGSWGPLGQLGEGVRALEEACPKLCRTLLWATLRQAGG